MKRWAESSLSGLGALTALIVFSEAAKAGSRFETTPIQSTKASAQLDFTIVIPEAIYVGSTRGDGEKDTPHIGADEPRLSTVVEKMRSLGRTEVRGAVRDLSQLKGGKG